MISLEVVNTGQVRLWECNRAVTHCPSGTLGSPIIIQTRVITNIHTLARQTWHFFTPGHGHGSMIQVIMDP